MVHICYSRITEPQLVFTDDLLDGRSQLKTNKGGGAERWCQDMPARYSLIRHQTKLVVGQSEATIQPCLQVYDQ